MSLNPRFDGAFLILKSHGWRSNTASLNPRFDGAFLILVGCYYLRMFRRVLIPDLMGLFWFQKGEWVDYPGVLIPDLMGLFWFSKPRLCAPLPTCLNPRFDGAFLIPQAQLLPKTPQVLIPDLMGLFWFWQARPARTVWRRLNPRFDGAFLIPNVLGGALVGN